MRRMTNKYIAELVARFMVSPQTQERAVAIQKFVEKAAKLDADKTYDEAELVESIKSFLDESKVEAKDEVPVEEESK